MSDYSRELAPEEHFKLANGHVARDLHELYDLLKVTDDKTFKHHVNDKRNDFANWVRYVYNDRVLANDLHRLKNREPTIKRLAKQLQNNISKAKDDDLEIMQQFETKEQEALEKADQEANLRQAAEEGMRQKIDEIIEREKEIAGREAKIQEIEERIEGKVDDEKGTKFFSKEFVQGLVVGVLICLIALLVYAKFLSELYPNLFTFI